VTEALETIPSTTKKKQRKILTHKGTLTDVTSNKRLPRLPDLGLEAQLSGRALA
jgi:hypothetical protein